jgi:hypothetical protein
MRTWIMAAIQGLLPRQQEENAQPDEKGSSKRYKEKEYDKGFNGYKSSQYNNSNNTAPNSM